MELKATVGKYSAHAVRKGIEKLNKRAVKLGVAPIVLVISAPFMKECKHYASPEARDINEHDYTFLAEVVDLTITGEAPMLAGWQFVGKIERLEGTNINLLMCAPGQTMPESYRNSDHQLCQHCNTRRLRKNTYILKHGQTGEFKQVGHDCIRDFTGGNDPSKQLKGWMLLLDAIDGLIAAGEPRDYSGSSGGQTQMFTVIRALTMTAALVERDGGYKFPSEEKGTAGTPGDVHTQLFMKIADMARDKIVPVDPTEADLIRAQTVIEWLLASTDESQYMCNLRVMLKAEKLPVKYLRMVVSGFYTYLKSTNQLRPKSATPELNEYVSEVGKRLRGLELTVEFVTVFDGMFGSTQIVVMKDAAGHTFQWYNSSANRPRQGAKLVVTGTVKKHEAYKGVCQTCLTRCTWELAVQETIVA